MKNIPCWVLCALLILAVVVIGALISIRRKVVNASVVQKIYMVNSSYVGTATKSRLTPSSVDTNVLNTGERYVLLVHTGSELVPINVTPQQWMNVELSNHVDVTVMMMTWPVEIKFYEEIESPTPAWKRL